MQEVENNHIVLKKEIKAVQIPSGDEITLPVGINGFITQKLGGTFTLATDFGLVRISEEYSDALGIDNEKETNEDLVKSQKLFDEGKIKEAIWEQLKLVFDPEIPVNIVNLEIGRAHV